MTCPSKIGRSKSVEELAALPSELLRGVTLRVALRGIGKEWTDIRRNEAPKWRPHLTQPTEHFDYFLSHDWGTSGRMKYFSLLMFFNSKASALVTFLCSSLLGVLCGLEILPKTVWWLIPNHIVSLLTLFFWQYVRDVFKLRLVFLDRLCIPQHDAELKSQCIYGLGSFLERSDTLLVLWSPRYCTRLWCMYEIGCFLLKQKNQKGERRHVRFLPVQMCVLWLLCYLQVAAIFATALVAQRVNGVFDWKTVTGQLSLAGVIVIQVLVLYPTYFYIMNTMLRDVDQMPRLFRDFRLEAAECFCCSCGHKHPATMEEVACDRQLIYEVMRHWSGESEDIQTVFKRHLDEHVMPSVETFHSPALFMRSLMSAVLVASCPFVGDFISVELTELIKQSKNNVFREAGLPVYVFFISLCLVRCSLLLGRLGAQGQSYFHGNSCGCVVLFQVLAFLGTSMLLGVGYSLAVAFGTRKFDFRPMNLLPFVLLSVVMLWSIYLYRTNRSKWSKISVADGDSQPSKEIRMEGTQEPDMDESMCKTDSGSTLGI